MVMDLETILMKARIARTVWHEDFTFALHLKRLAALTNQLSMYDSFSDSVTASHIAILVRDKATERQFVSKTMSMHFFFFKDQILNTWEKVTFSDYPHANYYFLPERTVSELADSFLSYRAMMNEDCSIITEAFDKITERKPPEYSNNLRNYFEVNRDGNRAIEGLKDLPVLTLQDMCVSEKAYQDMIDLFSAIVTSRGG
jgi:hypothetical protein